MPLALLIGEYGLSARIAINTGFLTGVFLEISKTDNSNMKMPVRRAQQQWKMLDLRYHGC